MLAMLGSVMFSIAPLNTHEQSHEGGADFAEKAVMGRRPTLEFVGEAADTRTISARLFPAKFGGLSTLSALHAQRQAGKPLPFMRGDGAEMGWYVIERVTETSSYLDSRGVGQVIEVEVSLKRADAPSGGALFSVLAGLL